MITTAIIAFREFLEAFLLIGIFIGIDRKLKLHRLKEILLASSLGIVFSLLLPIIVFFFAGNVIHIMTEKNTDILEGYLLTFSGFFLAYVIFTLHEFMKEGKKKTIARVSTKMGQEIFDISLFFTIVLFIAREGFEVALLIATTSLFSTFWINMLGLIVGFFAASTVGCSAVITYNKLPIKKIFRYSESLIVIMGATMVMNGASILSKTYFNIHLEKYLPLPLQFLPSDSSIPGHLLKNILGLQKEISIIQILLMVTYIFVIYTLFFRKNRASNAKI